MESKAFSIRSEGILDSLRTSIAISSDIAEENINEPILWTGIWDTGANYTAIDKRVAKKLKLSPVGMTNVFTANGIMEVNAYYINVGLPNGVIVKDLLVSESDLGDEIDVLIGMDVISKGDFSITNYNGKTTFSFRIPSIEDIDLLKKSKN